MIELKSCPFCGGEAKIVGYHHDIWKLEPQDFCVLCKRCGASSRHYESTKEKAIEAWNRRTE